ncbi:MAG: hypothetical protein RMH93_01935 [Aquificaceae bacterium]|nr:hypothetical protein [Aquificaceae bacterium]
MRISEAPGTKPTHCRLNLLSRKLSFFLLLLMLSFSSERERDSLRLAQTYFYRGYIEYTQGNYPDAIREFARSYLADKEGYYGELSYLYMGVSYARLFHRTGEREGLMSAIAYLNMYPYYYKKPTYLFLQREFIADSYLLMGLYDKARDLFLGLYRDTNRLDYLLNFLYADALSFGDNYALLNQIDAGSLVKKAYLYHLVRAFYAFNGGRYKEALEDLRVARSMNRYLEEDPEFLYRYAVSSFMERNLKDATFYFEQLDRRDLYDKYQGSTDYYLALIYLLSKNYADAKRRIDKMSNIESLKNRLLLSQLWLFPEFLQKYQEDYKNYKELLLKIAWRDLNSLYSIPAILGLYHYAVKERRFQDREVIRLKELSLPQEIVFQDIRVDRRPMLESLDSSFQNLDPYGESGEFLIELYRVNPHNYSLLFGYEKLSRAVLYMGKLEMREVASRLKEPLKSFMEGQLMLLEGKEEGLRLIERVWKELAGEDRQEALFLIGIYGKDVRLLEGLVEQELPQRLEPYLEPALLELGDYYYSRKEYGRAKEYYRRYLEIAQEGDLYWLVAYKLARAGLFTGDQKTVEWVVKKAEGKDNIISRVIVALWG